MSNGEKIKIGEAKGRPMLHWVGKQPLDYVRAFPAQKVEVFNPLNEKNDSQGLLFHGDNKDVLAWLLANGYRGQIDLIYIDPPFDSGADYIRNINLRGLSKLKTLDGESHSLGEQIQYTDIWVNDAYLQFMYERLSLLRELLSDKGSIYLHCDSKRDHHIRFLMDEVFGTSNFVNEIIWKYTKFAGKSSGFHSNHDTIIFYTKNDEHKFHEIRVPVDEPRKQTARIWDPNLKKAIQKRDDKGNLIYYDQIDKSVDDTWVDIQLVNPMAKERTDYPTQKPEALIERIIKASSSDNDLVLDCFVGSGTTAAVAQKLGRRWIAADINKGAIQTTSKRLQAIIQDQVRQGTLPLDRQDEVPVPASLSFSVFRVNDYDLQIQHNEAAKLAIEHVGIEELKSDPFFDGTRGEKLVKIIPFNHPLTLLDLQMVKDEIETRDDQRDILIVALGKETQVDPWLKEYNDHRPINKIEVIELRTDEKYGKFLVHQPAQAKVIIRREDGNIIVEIEDFISPTIIERLEMDTPLFKAQVSDWRSMVDCVMIDTDYDGVVFNIMLSDVPEKKDDFVVGKYELPAPEGSTTVAVKIIDMLGEEVIITMLL